MLCSPKFFTLFRIWQGFKNIIDVCPVLYKNFFRFYVTDSKFVVETIWCGIDDFDIFDELFCCHKKYFFAICKFPATVEDC